MRNLIALLALVYVNVMVGQLTYTSELHVQIGDLIEFQVNNIVDPETDFELTGENVEWDYADLVSQRFDSVRFVDPNESGYRSAYCLANFIFFNCQERFNDVTNIAVKASDSLGIEGFRTENIVRHFLQSKEQYSETMLGVSVDFNGTLVPIGIEFINPDTIYQFPFTYNSKDSSTSRLELDLGLIGLDVSFSRNRRRINHVDGYGSLKTPAGSYNEVLKMKTLIFNSDTTYYDTVRIVTTSNEIEYKWFAKGFADPVLQVWGLRVNDSELLGEVRWQSMAETSSVSHQVFDTEILVSPNPFNEMIQVTSVNKLKEFNLLDVNGHSVFSSEVNGLYQYHISTPDLDAGIYFLIVSTEKGNKLQKVIKVE
ncbi:T9SS type A sorting domain-containing protein [Portibacter marinus]|uniref:T9SS type A sorting domain-containing protein n=1 Tax=Portibacter marinus TaxID=2898660 RepID=UPI001F33340C|nr:T9SS type A sorting domain-containing protein [Portibacter marinus]